MKRFLLTIMALGLLYVCDSSAVIYQGKKFRHPKTKHVIYSFHDFHHGNEVSEHQAKQLIAWAQKRSSGSILATAVPFFIAEDMFTVDPHDSAIKEYRQCVNEYIEILRKRNELAGTVTSGLIPHVLRAGLHGSSIEFRHIREIFEKNEVCPITPKDLAELYTNVTAQIRAYDDCPHLTNYYQKIVNEFQKDNARYLAMLQTPFTDKEDFVYRFQNLMDHRLLEARIIHTLFQQRWRETIILCAGGDHLTYIEKTLTQLLGYEPDNYDAGTDLNKNRAARRELLEPDQFVAHNTLDIERFFANDPEYQRYAQRQAPWDPRDRVIPYHYVSQVPMTDEPAQPAAAPAQAMQPAPATASGHPAPTAAPLQYQQMANQAYSAATQAAQAHRNQPLPTNQDRLRAALAALGTGSY